MTAIIHYSTFLLSKRPAKKLYCWEIIHGRSHAWNSRKYIRCCGRESNQGFKGLLIHSLEIQNQTLYSAKWIQYKEQYRYTQFHVTSVITYHCLRTYLWKKDKCEKDAFLSLICQIPEMHWIKYMFMYANTLLWNSDYTWRHNQTSIFLESVCLTLSWCGMLIHVLLETNLKKVMSLHLSLICQITLMYWVNTFLLIGSIAMRHHCVTRFKITYRCVSIDMFGLMYLTGLGLQKKPKRGYQ